jgi:NADH-quinone oxidoreductase subunit J
LAHNLVLFYGFGAIAVVTTLMVIAQSNPIYSVLLLIASFMSLAGLYVLLDAPFVAVTQIIIYAGAIMVLFLFVVMLLNVSREEEIAGDIESRESGGARAFGTLLAATMAVELVWALGSATRLGGTFPGGERETGWTVREIGLLLFRNYAFAFEATSILILIAMIGAIALAGRHLAPRLRADDSSALRRGSPEPVVESPRQAGAAESRIPAAAEESSWPT